MGTMRKQIMGLAFCIAAIAPTAVAQTANTFPASGKVGIETISPSGPLSVTPTQYITGTASQSGYTVTGSGTNFTPAMVGSQLVFANGVSAGTITTYGSATQLTVSNSQTVTSQAYAISYTGLQVASNGNVGIGITTPANLLDIELNQDDHTAPLGVLKLGNSYTGYSGADDNGFTFSMGPQPFAPGQFKDLSLSGGSSWSSLAFLDNTGLGAANISFSSIASQGHNISIAAMPMQTADIFDVFNGVGGNPVFSVQPGGNVTLSGTLSTVGNISTNEIVASGGVVGSSVTSSTTVTAASLSVGTGATTPRTTLDVNGTIATQRLLEIYGSNDVAAGASVTTSGGILSQYGGPTSRGNQSWWQATAVGQQMIVDLGGPVLQIDGISFSTFYAGALDYIPAGYTIAYSTDNVTYTPVITVTGNQRPDVYHSFSTTFTARYIRITVNALQPGYSLANISGLRIYSMQGSGMSGEELWSVLPGISSNNVVLTTNGNVGIGTTNPGASDPNGKLEVNGDIVLTNQANGGGSGKIVFADGTSQSSAYTGIQCTGADYAEAVDVTGDRTKYEPGDLLVIDPGTPGKFLKSAEAYSTLVAGIYSTKPGFVGRLQPATAETSATEVPMAMVGRVPTKVTTENGPIKVGDLLVASSTPGHAMKGTDRSLLTGAVIGKALGSLDSGTGVIEVLVTLQ